MTRLIPGMEGYFIISRNAEILPCRIIGVHENYCTLKFRHDGENVMHYREFGFALSERDVYNNYGKCHPDERYITPDPVGFEYLTQFINLKS